MSEWWKCYTIHLATILVMFTCVLPTVSLTCTKIDNCSCRFDDDGSVVTLMPLVNNTDGTPLFRDQPGKDGCFYSYNPCYAFNYGRCNNTAVCQLDSNGITNSIVGQENVQFGYDSRMNVQILYLPTDQLPMQAIVSLVCVDDLTPPVFTAFGYQSDSNIYQFQIESMCACKNACYTHPPTSTSSSLGAGSILLIVFFVLVFLYLVLGTIHGKVVRKAKGLEMLPNYEFWAGLPSSMKVGCLYVVGCVCCQPKHKSYDEV